MTREAIGLVLATLIGSLSLAACEPKRTPPDQARTSSSPNVGVASSEVATGTPPAASKGVTPPVQGQVDPKEQSQRRDFEQRK